MSVAVLVMHRVLRSGIVEEVTDPDTIYIYHIHVYISIHIYIYEYMNFMSFYSF